jgi:hypothetical protein
MGFDRLAGEAGVCGGWRSHDSDPRAASSQTIYYCGARGAGVALQAAQSALPGPRRPEKQRARRGGLMRLAAVIGNQGLSDWKPQDSVRVPMGATAVTCPAKAKIPQPLPQPPTFPFRRRPSLQNSTSCLLASGKIILIFANKFCPSGWPGGQTLFGANDRKWREGRLR